MSEPLVSVIIPTYNRSNFVVEAIDSVLSQTYHDLEVIVINDGSTDNTADVLRSYGDRIVAINQMNGGTAAARNAGIAASRGEYIAFLDHDDLWRPTKLELQMKVFEANPEIGMVFCGRHFFNDATGEVTSVHPAGPEMTVHDFQKLNAIALQSAVIPRRIFDDLGNFDIAISGADDWELCLRIACKYQVVGVPDILVEIRGHPDQQSIDSEKMYTRIMSVFDQYENAHPNCNECRRSTAEGRRILREGLYQRMLASSKSAFNSGERMKGARMLLKAVRENPAAILRVPKRIVQRVFPQSHRQASSG